MDVCRCCLSNMCFKDMDNEYYCGGQKEIYSEILTKTFCVRISQLTNCRQLVCEDCILKLREAAAFKKQVLQAEDVITRKLDHKLDHDYPSLKLELDDTIDDFDDKISDDFNDAVVWNEDHSIDDDDGQIYVIKLEPKNEVTSISSKTEENNTSKLTRHNTSDDKIQNADNGITKRTRIVKEKSNKLIRAESRKIKAPISQYQLDLRENTLKLILNSNMCLFNSLKTKFRCYNCKETFIHIKELRDHSKIHSNLKALAFKVKRLRGLSYKNVDISNLNCKLCSETCNDLNELKNHLTIKHEIKFNNSEHLLIPYKLENDFQCVICLDKFNTYLRLSIHMNKHFTNNVCEICGGSYINRLSLRTHVHSMHRLKKCSICPATFQTNYSRVKHMKKCHNAASYKRYCMECNKTFRYAYLLIEHRVIEHGAKRQISNCIECGKSFLTPQNLRIHVRSVHLKERNHACSICGMRFFTKCDKRRHERTHEDVRSFSCNHCEGKFKSKDSWRRHCKRQHGHVNSQV